jgi:hypothetical protein
MTRLLSILSIGNHVDCAEVFEPEITPEKILRNSSLDGKFSLGDGGLLTWAKFVKDSFHEMGSSLSSTSRHLDYEEMSRGSLMLASLLGKHRVADSN